MAWDFDDPFEEERAFPRYFQRYAQGRRALPLPVAAPLPRVTQRLSAPLPNARPPAEEPAGAEEPIAAAPTPAPAKELSFIEVVLQRPDGSPLGSEPYRIKLPDGSLRQGKLGTDGRIRLDSIPSGDCEVRFPNLGA